MILRNGLCIFPDGVRGGLEVAVRDGKIVALQPATDGADDEIVDLAGNYLSPGFIDIHVHGATGRDTMEGDPAAFRQICEFHAGGGTTSLLLTTATAPVKKIVKVIEAIHEVQGSLPQVAGVHIEGPFLSRQKPGAQSVTHMRKPTAAATRAFLERKDIIRRMTIAPELPGSISLIGELVEAGIAPTAGHSDAWEEDARAAFEAGLRSVTHTFNCMSSSRRRGIDRVAGLLEFAMSEPEIICELIADGHHVSPTLMKMLYRAKGARGICLVTDATAGAGLPDGSKFTLSGKHCIAEKGVCFLSDRSALAGSAARMIDLVRTMIRVVNVPIHEAIAMATDTPAHAIGLTNKGQFKIGCDADFVVLSSDLEIERTFVNGKEIFRRRVSVENASTEKSAARE